MAVRSVIDIELDDSEFRRFHELFNKYREQLEETHPAWKQVGKDLDDLGKTTAQITGTMRMQQDLTRKLETEHKITTEAVERQERAWSDMARSTKSVATHIRDATRDFLKWTGVMTAFTGLLGIGGLFGIERLAMTAGTGRRNALGLGTTFGGQQAFGLNFGRLVDPNQFLGGVFEALHDVSKRQWLIAAGLTPAEMSGSTTQVGAALLGHLKTLADQTPEAMLAQVMQARGLNQFISLQDFERLKHTPAGEIAQYEKQFAADQRALQVPQRQLKAWQDLQVQLSRAGKEIENVFIASLAKLAPDLTKLSQAFADLVRSALGSGTFKQWVDDAAEGIKWFAGFIKSDEFKHDVEDFATAIAALAKMLGSVVLWLGSHVSGLNVAPARHSWVNPQGHRTGPGNQLWQNPDGTIVDPDTGAVYKEIAPGSFQWQRGVPPPLEATKGAFVSPVGGSPLRSAAFRIPAGGSLPNGLLRAVAMTESGGNPNAVSAAGAIGLMQFMPATARMLGINPWDPQQSIEGAQRYLTQLSNEFGGDLTKALAAYNWGPGNVQRDIAMFGPNWRSHIPQETERYIERVLRRLLAIQHSGRGGGVRITVQNNTGGSATLSAAQLST